MKTIMVSIFFLAIFVGNTAYSLEKGVRLGAFIKDPNGIPVNQVLSVIELQILSNNGCVLLGEKFSNVDVVNGYMFVNVFQGARSPVDLNDLGKSSVQVFSDSELHTGLACLNADGSLNSSLSSYQAISTDNRTIRIRIPDLGDGFDARFQVNSVPYAVMASQAANALTLDGKSIDEFILASSDILASKVTGLSVVATSGSYSDLSNKPSIPTSLSELTNDMGFLTSTSAPAFSDITNKPITLAGYGITDAQPFNAELSALGSVALTGILQRTGSNSYATLGVLAPLSVTAGNISISVGSASGTVAAGDDIRIIGALQSTSYNADLADVSACAANQKPSWNSGNDKWECIGIDSLNASAISGGTLDSARLPVASETADGIVNQLAQSFKGAKTYLDNAFFQGALNVVGAITGSSANFSGAVTADYVKVANTGVACNSSIEGSIRYNTGSKIFEGCNGTEWQALSASLSVDPCSEAGATPGIACTGGAIFLGTLSPGALSGTGTDKYMTTPSGCGEIPASKRVVTSSPPYTDYPSEDFTPTCSGSTDTLTKTWDDGLGTAYDSPSLVNYTSTSGAGNGAVNKDQNYGSANTAVLAAITLPAQGGYHAAALYCDKLVYGGYVDWYLPNRYELNLLYENFSLIPGIGVWYWSSTEYDSTQVWLLDTSTGNQAPYTRQYTDTLVRCVRKF